MGYSKISLILILLFICSLSSYAQNDNEKKKNDKENEPVNVIGNVDVEKSKVNVIVVDSNSVVLNEEDTKDSVKQQMSILDDAFQTALISKNNTIESQKKQIELLCTDTIKYRHDILELDKNIVTLKADKRKLEDEKNSYKIRYDLLRTELSKLDEVIYKQCLLYPLEAKYDKKSVEEAKRSIDAIQRILESPSPQFIKYRDIYFPLLTKYSQYNEELMTCIKKQQEFIEATGWSIGNAHRERFKNDIKSLSYYKDCYITRNNPPYKSILYLDNVIDKYLKIIDKTSNVQNDYKEILDSL